MRIVENRVLCEDRWLRFLERRYRDEEGREGSWTYVERRGQQRAAVVVARPAIVKFPSVEMLVPIVVAPAKTTTANTVTNVAIPTCRAVLLFPCF